MHNAVLPNAALGNSPPVDSPSLKHWIKGRVAGAMSNVVITIVHSVAERSWW